MNLYNAGINWLIKGHNGKLTLNYENRPVYRAGDVINEIEKAGRRGSWILQYQIAI